MKTKTLVNISIIFLGFGLLFLALKEFQGFIRPFIIAIILTFLFAPLSRLSQERKKLIWISTFAIAFAIFLISVIITSFLVSDSTQVSQVETLKQDNSISNLDKISQIEFANQKIDLSKYFGTEKITSYFTTFISKLISSLGNFFSQLFLVILFLIFLLPTHETTIKKIEKKLNLTSKKKFRNAMQEIEKNIRTYLFIKTTVSLITAVISGIILAIFGVKFIFLFSFLIFALNYIPSIGSIVAVGIVLLSQLILEPFSSSFFILAVLLILIQIIMGNLIEPQFAGKELELSPVIILLSLFFWGSVWGVAGMFFAVPLTSIIKIVLQNIDSTKNLVKFLS